MSEASQYCLRKLFKIGRYQVDVLRKEFFGKPLGLPYVLIYTHGKGGITRVRSFEFLRQRSARK